MSAAVRIQIAAAHEPVGKEECPALKAATSAGSKIVDRPGGSGRAGKKAAPAKRDLRQETFLKAPAERSADVRLRPPLPLASRHLQGLKLLEHSLEAILFLW